MNNEKVKEKVERKQSKELQAIMDAIQKYIDKHGNNVFFIGAIGAFKGKDCDIVDDRIFAYGDKDTLEICMEEFKNGLDKEEEFVNW